MDNGNMMPEKDTVGATLLRFWLFGTCYCGDAEVQEFLRAINVGAYELWERLKGKAVNIRYHIRTPDNYWVLACYEPLCEDPPNYVQEFHLSRRDILDEYRPQFKRFQQLKAKKRIWIYPPVRVGFFTDEKTLAFTQLTRTGTEPYRILRQIDLYPPLLLVQEGQPDWEFHLYKLMKSDLEIPATVRKPIDPALRCILGALLGAPHPPVAPVEVLLKYADATFQPVATPPGVQRVLERVFKGELRSESYVCSEYGEVVTMVSHRCGIAEHKVLLVDGELFRPEPHGSMRGAKQ